MPGWYEMVNRAGQGWSEEELKACVQAYALLWKAQQDGRRRNAAESLKVLASGAVAGRAIGASRMRFANLSHVLDRAGRPILEGFVPLRNISEQERVRLAAMLAAEGVL